jgi:hypothetical protein
MPSSALRLADAQDRKEYGDVLYAYAAGWEAALTSTENDTGHRLEEVIAEINDDMGISDEVRLERLKPLFALNNIELIYDPDS